MYFAGESVMLHLGSMIPKLKTRSSKQGGGEQSGGQGGGQGGGGKKKGKSKR